jgi:hypothetical protein
MAGSTIGGILRQLGLGTLAALEPRPPVVRYQRERPGGLIQIDPRSSGASWRSAIASRPRQHARRRLGGLHVCIDGASRLAYCEVLPDERNASAVRS